MTFVSDVNIQRKFNHTSHRTDPRWKSSRSSRGLLVGLTIGVPCLLMLLCVIFQPFVSRVPLFEMLLLAFFLPELFLLPVTLIRYAGDRRAFRCVSSGRAGDSLLFSEEEIVYTYYNQRDNAPPPRHEIVIPYRLIDQALIIPERQVFRIHGGGTDALYDSNGSLIRKSSYRTNSFKAKDCFRWVEIPLTYRDNRSFLLQFQQKTGIVPAVSNTEKNPMASGPERRIPWRKPK